MLIDSFSPTTTIQDKVQNWDGVRVAPYRFGGIEITLGTREIGLVQDNGMLELPTSDALAHQLLLEHKAATHPLYPHSAWVSFTIRTRADIPHAMWLLSIAHVYHQIAHLQKHKLLTPKARLEFVDRLAELNLSGTMMNLFHDLLASH